MTAALLTFTDQSTLPLGTIYCIGRNYAAHAKEMSAELSSTPVVFIKPPSALVANGGVVRFPDYSQDLHHEVELVVAIAQDCANIASNAANTIIAGYGVGLDMTLRDLQSQAKSKGEPWAVAKGFATSAPLSPFVPRRLFTESSPAFELQLSVDGVVKQRGDSKAMQRSTAQLIEYLAHVFTLRRGDCIFTGTPEGVGPVKRGEQLRAELRANGELLTSVEVKVV